MKKIYYNTGGPLSDVTDKIPVTGSWTTLKYSVKISEHTHSGSSVTGAMTDKVELN